MIEIIAAASVYFMVALNFVTLSKSLISVYGELSTLTNLACKKTLTT